MPPKKNLSSLTKKPKRRFRKKKPQTYWRSGETQKKKKRPTNHDVESNNGEQQKP